MMNNTFLVVCRLEELAQSIKNLITDGRVIWRENYFDFKEQVFIEENPSINITDSLLEFANSINSYQIDKNLYTYNEYISRDLQIDSVNLEFWISKYDNILFDRFDDNLLAFRVVINSIEDELISNTIIKFMDSFNPIIAFTIDNHSNRDLYEVFNSKLPLSYMFNDFKIYVKESLLNNSILPKDLQVFDKSILISGYRVFKASNNLDKKSLRELVDHFLRLIKNI